MAASFLGITAPWRNNAGRVSAFKIAALLLVIAPGVWVALQWQAGALGGRPINQAIRDIGDWIIRLLLLSLAVTPMRVVLDWTKLLQLRRLLGVATACYAVIHIVLYSYQESWNLRTVASEIVLRFYLTIGFVALTGLLVLAVTSTNGWQASLGRRWKKLHRLVFPIALLALLHYTLQSKADVDAPMLAVGVFVWVGLWRLAPRRFQGTLWLLPLLTIAATLITAATETAWYGLATGANAERVLLANLDVSYGLRPAVQVLALGVLVWLMAALRRVKLLRRRRPARNREALSEPS
jgi:sulfoxide reductase heme-binding subunit YedZ